MGQPQYLWQQLILMVAMRLVNLPTHVYQVSKLWIFKGQLHQKHNRFDVRNFIFGVKDTWVEKKRKMQIVT